MHVNNDIWKAGYLLLSLSHFGGSSTTYLATFLDNILIASEDADLDRLNKNR